MAKTTVFKTIKADSEKSLLSRLNMYFSKRGYYPKEWQIVYNGKEYIAFFLDNEMEFDVNG